VSPGHARRPPPGRGRRYPLLLGRRMRIPRIATWTCCLHGCNGVEGLGHGDLHALVMLDSGMPRRAAEAVWIIIKPQHAILRAPITTKSFHAHAFADRLRPSPRSGNRISMLRLRRHRRHGGGRASLVRNAGDLANLPEHPESVPINLLIPATVPAAREGRAT